MARVTTGSTFGCTAKQTMAMQLLSTGKYTLDEICIAVFDCVTDDGHQATDQAKLRKARATLRKWMKDPKVQECYRAIIAEIVLPGVGKALNTFIKAMDNPNVWAAKGAAGDFMVHFGRQAMSSDDKQITVQVTGAPELGEPKDGD